ncbi:MAG TPA: HAMP domain-containing sensor histidine kinase [Candidatus Latescibacteria bacterium]|nr:HAMP domain-containing sensor histidine kinase [Candidatus Latescibacterota bacterium]
MRYSLSPFSPVRSGAHRRPGAWVRLRWLRPGLFALGAIVVAAFVLYTLLVVRTLRQDAQRVAKLYAEKILPRAYSDPTITPGELRLLFDLIREMPVAVIVTDDTGNPVSWKGIDVPDTARSPQAMARIRRVVEDMDRSMPPRKVLVPLPDNRSLQMEIHVAESAFLRRIAWMPVVAAIVTLVFAGIAFWGFVQIKSGEQQALWAGMTKETAHQLGTPISSLSGWLEILKEEAEAAGARRRRADGVILDMSHDVERLRRIAQRFGQIGSQPELRVEALIPVIDETLDYFRVRLPTLGRDVQIERNYRAGEEIPLNRELLGWAFENIIRNSLDALARVEGTALIRVTTDRMDNHVRILFEDNGKGIPAGDLPKVFLPGFSTKKRGWGLGLPFVKRIVEDYHGGTITARSGGAEQGTTIEIRLPLD